MGMRGGDPLRSRFRLNLDQLRGEINHRFSIARHRKRHCDVVNEVPIRVGVTFSLLFGEVIPVQRPLKPIRVQRTAISVKDGQEVQILLSVVRAYDVPVRKENDPMMAAGGGGGGSIMQGAGGSVSESLGGPREARVHSYVEARFQVSI